MTSATKLNVAAGMLAMALVSAMVVRASSAAFTGETVNEQNSWDTGTVVLTDDDGGSALFSSGNMRPGDDDTACIEVTYEGSLVPSGPVELSATITDQTIVGGDGLGDDLVVEVRMGDDGVACTALPAGASSVVYSGALEDMADEATWTPAVSDPDDVRAFYFTVTLDAATANDAQGESLEATFSWTTAS
jgi:hypothetical protein